MKSRTFYSAIALLAGLLVFVGVAGFWGLTAQNPRSLLSKGGQEIPTAAQFVPRQAPLMASLLARPDRVWQLRQLLTPSQERFKARQEWQSLLQTLESAIGWDYDTDIRPWLDEEVTFAVTTADLDHTPENGLQAGYLLVLSCRDAQAAKEALHVLWQKRAAMGHSLIFESASEIALIHDQKAEDRAVRGLGTSNSGNAPIATLASAVVGDRYVLLANASQVLRQAIATYQAPDVSLANASNYRESLKTLPDQRIGWLYANIPNLLAWLGLEEPGRPFTIEASGQKASYLFMSFRAFAAGLMGDTAIASAPGAVFQQQSPTATTALSALNLLPQETLFATAGTDLSQLLTDLDANVGGYHIAQQSLKALLASLSLPSTDIPPELLTSLKGEYALAHLPGSTPNWILATQATRDQPLASIDTFAQSQGINVNTLQWGDRDLTTWTRLAVSRSSPDNPLQLQTQIVGVHTVIDNYEILSNSLAGLEQILGNLEETSLSKQNAFIELTKRLEKPVGTFAYLNWPALSSDLTRKLPWLRAVAQAGQPLTAHIGPIVLSGYGSSQSLQEGVVAIKLLESP